MASDYQTLLQATIQHLEDMQREGTKYVAVDPKLLTALVQKSTPRLEVPPPRDSTFKRPQSTPIPLEENPIQSVTPPKLSVPIQSKPRVTLEPQFIPEGNLVLQGEARSLAFSKLRESALQCAICPQLATTRKSVVFGNGDIHSPLLFVGEAPGAEEDQAGEPFVGRAGELLTRIIHAMGQSRDSVYIANILKCRPHTSDQAFGNRKPTAEEIQNCLPYLKAQIELIRPKVIVALGGTAMEGLFGKLEDGITKLRGRWQLFQGISVMPTYHPSYLLRNQMISVKREVWEDMIQVLERLGNSISEKQRNFFK